MNDEIKSELRSRIDAGENIQSMLKAMLPAESVARTAEMFFDPKQPGFVTYCPGGIDPQTGGCLNNGLVVPDPLGHLAGMIILHST